MWLYEPNGTPAQKWLLADPAIPRAVDDGPYRLASSLDGSMARRGLGVGLLAVAGRGRPQPRARRRHRPLQDLLGRHAADRVRQVGGAGRGGRLRLPAVARLGPRAEYTVTSASGLALDVSGADASEGNAVWLYEPNGTPAQKWLLADPAIPRAVDDGPYRLASSLDGSMAVAASRPRRRAARCRRAPSEIMCYNCKQVSPGTTADSSRRGSIIF